MPLLKFITRLEFLLFCKRQIIPLILWIILASFGAVWAAPTALLADSVDTPEVRWSAVDSTRVDAETGAVLLFGSAWVELDGMRLEAERIVYTSEDDRACAYGVRDSLGVLQGRPVLIQGAQRFEQDSLCFDLETRRGYSVHAVTQQGEAYFHAGVSKRQADETIHVANGMFTTCDAANPHYHFQLNKAIMIPGEKIVSGPFFLKVRKVPMPLGLPFGWFPTAPEKRSRGLLMPGYGDGGELGFFLKDLGYYVPIGEYAGFRLVGDVYSGGTWALRTSANYAIRYKASGALNLSFQRRRVGFSGATDLSIDKTFFVRWNHTRDPRSRPFSRFSANVNFGSSNNFQSNLSSSQQEFLSNTFQSSIQWSHSLPQTPFSLAASARHTQNSTTGNVDVTVPSLTVNMNRSSVAKLLGVAAGRSRLLDDVQLTASSRFEQTFSAPDSVISAGQWSDVVARNGLKHTASATSSLRLGFVSITPSASYNEFWAFQQIDQQAVELSPGVFELNSDTLNGFASTRDWRVSANASTRFYGMFRLGSNSRLSAIRHVLSPSVGLSYTPENTRTRELTLGDDVVTWNPFGLSRFLPGDIRSSGAANFSLSQNLEAKVKTRDGEVKKVKLIDNIVTSANYNFMADSIRLSEITTRAFTNLFNRVNVNVSATHNAYARDSLGQVTNQLLSNQGLGLARLTRANAALGSSFQGGNESGWPWNVRLDYTVNANRVWNATVQADSTQLRQSFNVRGGATLFNHWRVDIQSGYDLVQRELTPTNLNIVWDLHCWELAVNWIPFGARQSFYIRLNIKASMLRDLKIEARSSNGQLIF